MLFSNTQNLQNIYFLSNINYHENYESCAMKWFTLLLIPLHCCGNNKQSEPATTQQVIWRLHLRQTHTCTYMLWLCGPVWIGDTFISIHLWWLHVRIRIRIHEWKLVKGLTAGRCCHCFTASYLATVSNNNSKIHLIGSNEFSEFSIQPFSYSVKNNVGWLKWRVLIQCWFRGELKKKHH